MQTIRLPQRLDTIDLEALNRSLHANELTLDWSDVQPGIPPTYLQRLLAGLTLSDCIDAIGGSTIPDQLQPELLAAFAKIETHTAKHHQQVQKDTIPTPIAPALWVPETQLDTIDTSTSNDVDEPLSPYSENISSSPDNTHALPAQPTSILEAPSPAQMRAELEEMVVRDLLGPAGGPEEELDEARVHERYLIGMLAPNKTQTAPEEMDPLANAETGSPDQGADDEATTQKPTFNPASLGMSFCVDGNTTELLVTARWGHYQKASSESLKTITRNSPKTIWNFKR